MTMTIEEVLKMTADQMGEIPVPAQYAETIAMAIHRAQGNIYAVLDKMAEKPEGAEESAEKDGGAQATVMGAGEDPAKEC